METKVVENADPHRLDKLTKSWETALEAHDAPVWMGGFGEEVEQCLSAKVVAESSDADLNQTIARLA